MDKKLRVDVVRAMETMARCVNNEEVFECWLMCGVADGDIEEDTTDEELEYYTEDSNFEELLSTFIRLMYRAYRDGGLYVDGICSEELRK